MREISWVGVMLFDKEWYVTNIADQNVDNSSVFRGECAGMGQFSFFGESLRQFRTNLNSLRLSETFIVHYSWNRYTKRLDPFEILNLNSWKVSLYIIQDFMQKIETCLLLTTGFERSKRWLFDLHFVGCSLWTLPHN